MAARSKHASTLPYCDPLSLIVWIAWLSISVWFVIWFSFHFKEFLNLTDVGGVEDDVPAIFPRIFAGQKSAAIEHSAHDELVMVHLAHQFFTSADRYIYRHLVNQEAVRTWHIHRQQKAHHNSCFIFLKITFSKGHSQKSSVRSLGLSYRSVFTQNSLSLVLVIIA